MVMDVRSMSASRLSISADMLSLIDMMVTTAPTPMTMPIIVSQLLTLL
jgi:hypothetical protein